MPDLPTGTVTFLLTDIEGSTRLWEQYPDAMGAVVARHDTLLTRCIERHGGHVVRHRGEGDSFFAVFVRAADAVAAACALQLALLSEPWPEGISVRVRAGMHTGECELREGDYYGTAINRCARVRAVGHGGQTLLSQATSELVASNLPEEVTLRDLGLHRLKDLQRRERIYQLLHPDLPGEFPPPNSLDALPNNLPQPLTSFIGREREMAEVKQVLATTRLLTLTGAGGSGKTRLALQVAADLLGEYRDGVWLVELAPLSDPALVPQAVASALAVHEEPGRPLATTLSEQLQARHLLLILDNCEHLVAACATLSQTLLQTCPNLRVLATSREILSVPGETTWRVPPLSLPEPDSPRGLSPGGGPGEAPVAALTQYEAIRLFIDRALSSQPSFTVTDQNAPAMAQVCRQLDGMPLAIELAAARVKVLSVEQIAGRLEDRFRLLTGGSRTALPRQRTLRALIDWSYDLLSVAERLFWQRLSVFAGGFALEAAEAVCSDCGLRMTPLRAVPDCGLKEDPSQIRNPQSGTAERSEGVIRNEDVLDLLTQLVDKSLVVVEEATGSPEGQTAGSVAVRYRLLETIRQYGAERLQHSGEGALLRERHRDWYLDLAEQAEVELLGSAQQEWLERLEQEHANLRVALEWTSERQEAPEGLRIAGALWRFWAVRGYYAEGRERLAKLLALEPREDLAPARAKALHGAGALAFYQGDYEAARAFYEESLALRRGLGDPQGIAASLNNLASVAKEQGDYGAARARYEESLALYRQLGDRRGIALSLNNLGLVADGQGDYAGARALHEESLQLRRDLGDREGIATSLHNLGDIACALGDDAAARALYEESLEIARELGNRWSIAGLLQGLGNVAFYQRDLGAARALYEESLGIQRELGNRRGIADMTGSLGLVAHEQGELERAAALYRESLDLFHDLGDHVGIAVCLEGLAGLTGAWGQAARAARLFGAAEGLRAALGAPLGPRDREPHERRVAAARAGLEPETFAAAWAAGRQLTLEEALVAARATAPPT